MRRSEFVEEDVRWRVFRQAIREARAAFADVSPKELKEVIDEAVEDVRVCRSSSSRSGTHSVNYNP